MINPVINYDKTLKVEDVQELNVTDSGIYFICSKQNVLYIGQSSKLKARLRTHFKAKSDLQAFVSDFDKVGLIFQADPHIRLAIEEYMINLLNPPLNLTIKKHLYCKAKKKDGSNCKAVSHENGFCYLHGGNGIKRNKNRVDFDFEF